jgi:hypothetical protein
MLSLSKHLYRFFYTKSFGKDASTGGRQIKQDGLESIRRPFFATGHTA